MSAKIESWQDIQELASLSIGTDKGSWWADPDFGSELWLLKSEGKTDGNTEETLARLLRECLAWLVRDGLCESIDVRTERSGKHRISYTVTLFKLSGGSAAITEVWSVI
jgi:phage gp46-like protein